MSEQKKRIGIVSPFPPPYGGMAIQAEKLVSSLRQDGYNVVTVKTNPDFPPRYRFIDSVKALRTIARGFLFLKNLTKILSEVDLLYFLTGFFNFFFWITYPALIVIMIKRKRVILSARGGGARLFFQRYGFLVRPILKKVDAITVPSAFLEDVFRETLNLSVMVIPNIADLTQFTFRRRISVRPRLLATRSLEEIYNVACIIRAFKKVHDRFPESELGIVGDGSQREQLEQVAVDLGLEECVIFYGPIDHSEIQNYYDKYDIYVNASNVDNLPGTILEAYASGLPVVTTNPGGIPYMVKDQVTGLLVNTEDPDSLAEKVIELVEHPEAALKLAENAREECRKYLWKDIKTKLLPLLAE